MNQVQKRQEKSFEERVEEVEAMLVEARLLLKELKKK